MKLYKTYKKKQTPPNLQILMSFSLIITKILQQKSNENCELIIERNYFSLCAKINLQI